MSASASGPGPAGAGPPAGTLAGAARLRRIEGSVDPYPQDAPVVLERRSGGRWSREDRAPTTARGGYAFAVAGPGSYRVVAGWAIGPVLRLR